MTFDGAVTATGYVRVILNAASVNLNAPLDTTGATDGSLALSTNGGMVAFGNDAGDDVTLNGTFTHNGTSDVTINADITTTNDTILFGQMVAAGSITMTDGTQLNVNGTADIRLLATGDISISRLVNDSTDGIGTVIAVESTAGGIIDSGDTGGADIVTETVRLEAVTGIGGDGTATDAALNEDPSMLPSADSVGDAMIEVSAIDTEVRNVAASNTAGGDIRIHNSVGGLLTIGTADGLSGVTNADAGLGGGAIQITNESPITVGAIGNPGDVMSDAEGVFNTAGGSIVITAIDSAGDDDLTLNAPVRASGGNGSIVLNAGDDLIANSHIETAAVPSGGLTRAGNIDLNAGAQLDLNDGPEQFDIQTGTPGTLADVEDTEFDANSSRLSNRQIRYAVGSSDEADVLISRAESALDGELSAGATTFDVEDGSGFMTGQIIRIGAEDLLVDSVATNTLTVMRAQNGTMAETHAEGTAVSTGVQFATYSGIVNGLPGLYALPGALPQVGADGGTTATVAFGNARETNFRILVSWGDDSFSFDHVSAEDIATGDMGTVQINDSSDTMLDGEFLLEFDHLYDARNLPDPDNPGDPIPIRVLAQADPNVLFVRSDDSIIVPTIDDALASIPQDTLDVVGADENDTSAAGVKAASPYLSTSETVLPSDLFAELEAGGRVDSLRSALMPNETQDSQFSEEIFNKESSLEPGPGNRTILDASLEEVLETVLPAEDVRIAGDNGVAVDPIETFNFTATGALAPVPGTVPNADPIVFELDTFVPPVEREESGGLGDAFTFTTSVIEQAVSEFVVAARGEEAAAEERIVWLVVLKPVQPGKVIGSNGIRTEVQLTEEVLDDLPGRVYKRLPDGDYQIYLQEAGESKESRKLIIEVRIRDGKPAEEEKAKIPPKPKAAEEEAESGQPNDNGNQNPNGGQGDGDSGSAEEGNAQQQPDDSNRKVSFASPSSLQDEAWAMWAKQTDSAVAANDEAEAPKAEQRTAGLSSTAAVVAGAALLSLRKGESWQREVDNSMADWKERQRRKPR